MNADTLRAVKEILNNGYYPKCTTLGEGGWGKVYSFAANWNKYTLFNIDTLDGTEHLLQPIETITAANDEAALKAFKELYNLDNFAFEIYCNVTTSRLVYADYKE